MRFKEVLIVSVVLDIDGFNISLKDLFEFIDIMEDEGEIVFESYEKELM